LAGTGWRGRRGSVTQVSEATGATPTTTSVSRLTTRSSAGDAASFAAHATPPASCASTAATPRYNALHFISDPPFVAPLQRGSIRQGMDKMSGFRADLIWVTGRASGTPRLTQIKARGGAGAHAGGAVGHGRHRQRGSPMQFHVQLDTGRIDLASLEQQLQSQDPSALADFDALTRTLRISTTLAEGDVAAGL